MHDPHLARWIRAEIDRTSMRRVAERLGQHHQTVARYIADLASAACAARIERRARELGWTGGDR